MLLYHYQDHSQTTSSHKNTKQGSFVLFLKQKKANLAHYFVIR